MPKSAFEKKKTYAYMNKRKWIHKARAIGQQ